MSLAEYLLCLLHALTQDQCILTDPSTIVPSTTVPFTTVPSSTVPSTTVQSATVPTTTKSLPTPQNCSFDHCHVFKDGNLVLFPSRRDVRVYGNKDEFCSPFNGTIFVPRTEEDNKIWLEFIKMLHDEDNSFKVIWYPMAYDYLETKIFYWFYDTYIEEVDDSDYTLKIDDPNDGQPDFDDLTFADYDSRGGRFIYFSHDIENVFGQLQIRDESKEVLGFAVCLAL